MTIEQQPIAPPDDSAIEEYLSRATHDQLKKLPSYNKRFQDIITDARTEADRIRQEARDNLAEQEKLAQWDRHLSGMTPEQRAKALEDPDAAQAWAAIQQSRNQRVDVAQVRYQAISDALGEFEQELKQEPDFEDFDWGEFHQEKNPARALRKLVDHGAGKTISGAKANMKEEITAAINEELARRGMNRVQPDNLPATGADAGMTYERLEQMSPSQRREFRVKDPALYDQIITNYRRR